MRRTPARNLEIGYVIEKQKDSAQNYRELWASVVGVAIADACDFENGSMQKSALNWLFGSEPHNAEDREFVFGLLGMDVALYSTHIARRIIAKARAFKNIDPNADDEALREYLGEHGIRAGTFVRAAPSFSERVKLKSRQSRAARFLTSKWGQRLRRIAQLEGQ